MERTEITLGRRIAALRKSKNLRQDDLAERLSVSPQAVSKWENDISCPDISLLPDLAKILDVTVDELLSGKPAPVAQILPAEARKNVDEMVMRMTVDTAGGDKIRINFPMGIIRALMTAGPDAAKSMNLGFGDSLKNIDFATLLTMVDSGIVGNLLDVESAGGDVIHIFVE